MYMRGGYSVPSRSPAIRSLPFAMALLTVNEWVSEETVDCSLRIARSGSSTFYRRELDFEIRRAPSASVR